MSDNRSAELHALVPVGNWESDRWRLSSIVLRSRVAQNPEAALDLVRGVSTYGEWSLQDPKLARKCGSWVYGGASNLDYINDTMQFSWSPPIIGAADAEDSEFVEELVDERPTSGDYSWPNVMLDLRMIVDVKAAAASGLSFNLNSAVERGLWRNGVNTECQMRVRTYISLMPPPLRKVRCDRPIGTEIRGDYFGTPVRIPSCLHPLVELESINTDEATIFDCTPTRDSIRTGNKLTYRPTNHQSWQKHVASNKVPEPDNGIYRRIETVVFPPRLTGLSYT